MIISHIAAMAENRVIGANNSLPWHIPDDLKFFKEKTNGHILIMGRKTFESIKAPLPSRFHIVVTRKKDIHFSDHPLVSAVSSLEQAYQTAKTLTSQYGEEVFIAGGGEIYTQSLSHAQRLYLTIIHKKIDGDTFYPNVDWTQYSETRCDFVEHPIAHTYKTFIRNKHTK